MHVASQYGHVKVVKLLIAHGANPYAKNKVSNVIFVVLYDVVCGDGELMMRIVNTVIVMLFVLL